MAAPHPGQNRQNATLSSAALRRKLNRTGQSSLRTGSGTTDGVRWERFRSYNPHTLDRSRFELTVDGEKVTIPDRGQSPAEVVAQAKREVAERKRRRAAEEQAQQHRYRRAVREELARHRR